MCLQIIYLIYMYKQDLALNNLQWLICHKTKPKKHKEFMSLHFDFLYILFNNENLPCSIFIIRLRTQSSKKY